MYIDVDLQTPTVMTWVNNKKLRNRIVDYWPRTTVVGVTVMDKLYLYRLGSGGVQIPPDPKNWRAKLYTLLNIKVEDLQKEEWDGVEDYYLEFKPKADQYDNITKSQIYVFALKNSSEADWSEIKITYEAPATTETDAFLSDEEIVNRIKNDPQLAYYDHSTTTTLSVPFALMDNTNVMFDTEIKVRNRRLIDTSITTYNTTSEVSSRYIKVTTLALRWKLKAGVTEASVDALLTKVHSFYMNYSEFKFDYNGGKLAAQIYRKTSSLSQHLVEIHDTIVPIADSTLIYPQQHFYIPLNAVDPEYSYTYHYKDSGIRAIPSNGFKKIMGTLESGFTEEEVSGWTKFWTGVFVALVIVLAIYTGGLAAAGLNGLAALGAFASAAALTLTLGLLVGAGIASIYAENSNAAIAAYIGKSMQHLGAMAKFFGIVAMIAGIGAAIQKISVLSKQLAQERLEAMGTDVLIDPIHDEISKSITNTLVDVSTEALPGPDDLIASVQWTDIVGALKISWNDAWSGSLAQNLNKGVGFLSQGWQLYEKYILPDPQEDVSKKQAELNAQMQELEDTTGPDTIRATYAIVDDPFRNIYDFNEYMQTIPKEMTQGKIDKAFTKYYN